VHEEEFYNVYCSTDINRVIKSRKTRWAWHMAHRGEMRDAYEILMGRN
jgi:hypothetical protein